MQIIILHRDAAVGPILASLTGIPFSGSVQQDLPSERRPERGYAPLAKALDEPLTLLRADGPIR